MPLATLACTVDATGIHSPTFAEIFQSLQEQYQTIYGSDIAITEDTKDGQWLAALAQHYYDQNQVAILVYQGFRPGYAQGAALDSILRINGVTRGLPSTSAAEGKLYGQSGTVVTNGVVEDQNGNKWDLPEEVTIPDAGEIQVTITSQADGAIVAPTGTINKIVTPVRGWQEFASTSDSLPGTPIETDAALRRRQKSAASLPANGNVPGLLAALEALEGVTRVRVYENDENGADANGLVAHSIAVVIEGGNDLDIATTIGQKKAPGCNLNGDVIQSYTDPLTAEDYDIKFYRLTTVNVQVDIALDALDGWNDTVKAEIQAAVAEYINGLDIGETVRYSRVYTPANLSGLPDGEAFSITQLLVNAGGIDVVIPFKQVAVSSAVNVTENP